MTMNQHTPGPCLGLHIHNPTYPCSCWVKRDGNTERIVYCSKHAAAPELLEALHDTDKELTWLLTECVDHPNRMVRGYMETLSIRRDKIRAAIRKAEGG